MTDGGGLGGRVVWMVLMVVVGGLNTKRCWGMTVSSRLGGLMLMPENVSKICHTSCKIVVELILFMYFRVKIL
jgi:hypothetical protein